MINKNYILAFVGIVVFAAGMYMKLPPTLNYLTFLESAFVKYAIVAAGLVFISISIWQFMSKKRLVSVETVRRSVLTLVLAAVFLVFLEAYLRAAAPADPFRDHDIYHHAMIPNFTGDLFTGEFRTSINVNSLGLRDDELTQGKYRILVLGDSFTWGFGVGSNETFSNRLEEMLGGSYEVVNAGATSYSPVLEYLYFREDGARLRPDMVILSFDMSDVFDDGIYESFARFNGPDLVKIEMPRSSGLLSQLSSPKIMLLLKGVIESAYSHLDNKTVIRDSPYLGDLRQDKYAIMRFTDKSYDAEWNRTLGYIIKIRDLARANNATFVLVVYPYGNQVNGREWQRGRFTFAFEEGITYPAAPAKVLEEFGRKEGITVVNTVQAFRNSSEFPLFFSYDGHFTAKGHEVMASALFDALKSGLIA